MTYIKWPNLLRQPRSQALSSLPTLSLSSERKNVISMREFWLLALPGPQFEKKAGISPFR